MDEFVQNNEKVATVLEESYLIMKVNMSPENDNHHFLSRFPRTGGYPHIFVLDCDGTCLHSQGTGELEEGNGYNESVFIRFLDEWKPDKT